MAVPSGMMPRAASLPTMPWRTSWAVPSPPQAMTVSHPPAMAWRACSPASACPRVGSAVASIPAWRSTAKTAINVCQPPRAAPTGERVVEQSGLAHQDWNWKSGWIVLEASGGPPGCAWRQLFTKLHSARGPFSQSQKRRTGVSDPHWAYLSIDYSFLWKEHCHENLALAFARPVAEWHGRGSDVIQPRIIHPRLSRSRPR